MCGFCVAVLTLQRCTLQQIVLHNIIAIYDTTQWKVTLHVSLHKEHAVQLPT